MIGRLFGAALRALMVGVLFTVTVATMPDVTPAAADGFGLVTIVICVIVLLEYGFKQPALLEFRFAAPYNRWRFLSLMLIMFGFVVLCGNVVVPTPFNLCVRWLADFASGILSFYGSPAMVMNGMLSSEVTPKAAIMIVPMASMGYLMAFGCGILFAIYLVLSPWPTKEGSFKFWSNLPTFQTVQPETASRRLMQVGILSLSMTIVFPYVIPAFLKTFSDILPIQSFMGDFTLFWVIAICTWLPLVCFMRGLALIKVSRMIRRDLGV